MSSKLDMKNITDRLFYETKGQIFISALFGLAIALLFQRVCKDRKCIIIRAPNVKDFTSKVYEFEGECYKYTTASVSCPKDSSKQIITE